MHHQTCHWITLKWFNQQRVCAVFESFGCWDLFVFAAGHLRHRFAWYSNVFEYSQTLIALYVVCDHIVTAIFISSLKYSTTPPHTASWYALVQPPTHNKVRVDKVHLWWIESIKLQICKNLQKFIGKIEDFYWRLNILLVFNNCVCVIIRKTQILLHEKFRVIRYPDGHRQTYLKLTI